MILSTYVHDLSPFLIQFSESLGLRWYGLAYVGAFLSAFYLYQWLARHGYSEVPEKDVGDLITWWVVLGTLIGGRVGYMLFYDWTNFIQNPLILFRVWEGGMASHGGILGIVVATWLYARRHRVHWLNIGDNLVVTAPIGLFLGRCANFINGELYGRPTDVSWAIKFPKELYSAPWEIQQQVLQQASLLQVRAQDIFVLVDQARGNPQLLEIIEPFLSARHPSQIYQALLEGVALFLLLWILRTRLRLPNGVVTGAFFIGYAVFRFIGEFFREPDAPLTAWMTRGQFLSLFLIVIGLAFILYACLRPSYAPGRSK